MGFNSAFKGLESEENTGDFTRRSFYSYDHISRISLYNKNYVKQKL